MASNIEYNTTVPAHLTHKVLSVEVADPRHAHVKVYCGSVWTVSPDRTTYSEIDVDTFEHIKMTSGWYNVTCRCCIESEVQA